MGEGRSPNSKPAQEGSGASGDAVGGSLNLLLRGWTEEPVVGWEEMPTWISRMTYRCWSVVVVIPRGT
jgi:hypothetical protein